MGNRRKEAGLTDQQSTGVLNGQQQQVSFTHISCGQGNYESELQTLTVCSFLGGRWLVWV